MKQFFRADHVGSLLRPESLKQARAWFAADQLSNAEFASFENEAIDHVLAKQADLGLQAVTDGEFRRAIYFGHFNEKVDGYTMMESNISFDEDGKEIKYLSPAVTGKLKWVQGIATNELYYVKNKSDLVPKITLPSPTDQHMFRYREGISDAVYPDLEEFFTDVAAVYQAELQALAAKGATYVQLDDTTFTLFCDEKWRGRVVERGYDPDKLLTQYVDLINSVAANAPADITLAMHMCRGNNQGEWLFSGGYDAIAEQLFSDIQLDSLFLEYDTERAGTFMPLRYLPQNKFVVLGLVTSKSPALEKQSDLIQRIETAAKHFPIERMGLSPQCGFASTLPGNPLTEDDQWRKLALVVETAEQVWGTLSLKE